MTIDEEGPQPAEHAETVARVCTQIGVGIAGLICPPAALMAPVMDVLVDKIVNRPKALLIQKLQSEGLTALTAEQAALLYPMGTRYFNAAQAGEYRHNLRILAGLIAGELKKDAPQPARINKFARQIEGLSLIELQTIALIDAFYSETKLYDNDRYMEKIINSSNLFRSSHNKAPLSYDDIWPSLAELSGRAIIVPEGASRMDKYEEYYLLPPTFFDLINDARQALAEETADTTI